jgi:GLPGLI family protein
LSLIKDYYNMKRCLIYFLSVSFILIVSIGNSIAQDFKGGIVKYQKTTKYNFEPSDNQRWNDLIADLPKEKEFAFVLYLTHEEALYEENLVEQEAIPHELRRALHRQSFSEPPQPKAEKVYYNISKGKKFKQMEFMTRNFIVESEIKNQEWKLNSELTKILNYNCMNAEIVIDGQEIRVWFTSEIPVPVGPDEYYGLPGLILAVEKNGVTILLATSIELTIPTKEQLTKPKDGKKLSPEKFEKIVEEKKEEFRKTGGMRHKGKGKGRH